MNASEYQDWMSRAFLNLEGALATELSTPGRQGMTEDYVRGSFLRGLLISNPLHSARVVREHPASWSSAICVRNPAHSPAGRPLQHDIAVAPTVNVDVGLVCEVKWLVQAKASSIAADIWKLALSRSNINEAGALRTYLLVGGESTAFSQALSSLSDAGLKLRWSAAGGGGGTPRPTTLALEQSLSKTLSHNAWEALVSWGKNPVHHRTPPLTWSSLRCSLRQRWLRTIPLVGGGSIGWRMVLWELDHRGVENMSTINWSAISHSSTHLC
jgi:hypothetical protein